MGYQLGIDLGTTWTAAAVCRDGQDRPEVLPLGSASSAVASVVFLAPDGTLVLGEAAQRRALTEPRRVAREFKRRIGDDTPLMVGGEPVAAAELSARFVAWVVDEAARREGGPADAVAVTHPVEWGGHKRATFAAALAGHGLGGVTFLTEPQAAAVGYASAERIEPGAVVGVYDLGGGTFDAAVVRKLPHGGFELLGRPAGIERLGGIDFDDAILDHVRTALGPAWQQLDPADPATQAAVAGLRRECTAAKEALSADTEVLVPVMLPGVHTQVRLGRAEFEDMIRPAVGETVEALRRAVASTGFAPGDLDAVLLVGGSSRIPLVSQLVSAELGRPVAVDADPKTVVAAGAALTARGPLAAPEPGPALDDGAPVVPPVAFDAPPVDDDGPAPRRTRRTLVLAATVAVIATLGLSATIATGVVPVPVGTVAADATDAADAPAAAAALPDGPVAPAEIDPWTGTAPAATTVAPHRRPEAVAAAVRPVARTVPTGAAGASAVPRPAPATPATGGPAAGTPAATTPGTGTPATGTAPVVEGAEQVPGGSAPADPGPADPAPTEPDPVAPAPTEPDPTGPAPTEPDPAGPVTTEPAPAGPPAGGAETESVTPTTTATATDTPATP
ncbi:Hsp70 family protein [Pseudonocardia hydrocarbonoxydans]|uniref:Hsp70 family protein n=1 Tax=Pseudonocardia hydrocarbonoxydans TaxID=76726 RepID=UPI0031E1A934